MTTYAIMQEPGRRAHARRDRIAREFALDYMPRMKRAGTVTDVSEEAALGSFIRLRYFDQHGHPINRQFESCRHEWRTAGNRKWRPDDGKTPRGRRWSVVVTLRNGSNVHETRFVAWKEDAR